MQNENCFIKKIKLVAVIAAAIIGVIGFASCNVLKNNGQVVANKNSDWYKMNLKGRVKTLSWNSKDNRSSAKGKVWFNELGFLVKWEQMELSTINMDGQLLKDSIKGFAVFKFDNKGNLSHSIITEINFHYGDTSVVSVKNSEFNKLNNIIKEEIIVYSYEDNPKIIDTSMLIRYYQYDEFNNRVYDSIIYENSFFVGHQPKTAVKMRNYDKKGRIVFEKEISYEVNDSTHCPISYTEYKLSYKGNWQTGNFFQGKYKNFMEDTVIFNIQNSRVKVSRNKNGDVVRSILINNKSKQIEKFNYKYDENNNWTIKKGERVRVNLTKGDTVKFIIVGTQEIEYYK